MSHALIKYANAEADFSATNLVRFRRVNNEKSTHREDATDGGQRYAYELDATEVGASLKWATVKVTKATRDTSSGSADR